MGIDYVDFLRDLAIDLLALYIFAFLIFYRRYGDRDMTITLALLNLFLFTIVITMTMTEFTLAAGFALFALLSIISLRSVSISKIDVGYLLGAITLGLVNGISMHDYLLLALCNLVILVGPWVFDSSWLLKPTVKLDVTLDVVIALDLKDHAKLVERVRALHGLPVIHLKIERYNAKKGTVQLVTRLRLS
ncbi:MAG: DUF4956 domain-containing protein [Gammaproteobacteria bacterium]|nr:DUF4956 domain-containing protein [Gammaproteobacteria bacterium]